MPLTQADLYEYRNMCAGKYGPQWTAIRKLLDEVRRLDARPARDEASGRDPQRRD